MQNTIFWSEIIIQCKTTIDLRYFKGNIYLLIPKFSKFCVIYTMPLSGKYVIFVCLCLSHVFTTSVKLYMCVYIDMYIYIHTYAYVHTYKYIYTYT